MESYKKIILIFLLLLVGCKTKQVTVTKTEYVRDTIFKEKIVKINVPVTQFVEVESPCDSLGVLKPFKMVLQSDKVNVTVQSKDGKLTAEINLDSIKQVAVKEYKSHNSVKVETKEVIITKYRLPSWFWWAMAYAILMTVWKFKKYIPYLNMLPF